jgi:hypothetical protein
MRRFLITAVLAASLTAGCAPPVPTSSPVPTVPVGEAALPAESPPVDAVRMAHPENAVSIQVCLDVAPDALADGIERGPALLDNLADYFEQLATEEGLALGVFVEVWTTADDSESGAPLVEAQLPDYDIITVEAGLAPNDRNAKLALQAVQRGRADSARVEAGELVELLRSVPVPTTSTTDVLRCISRANAVAAGRDDARRILVVASSLPVSTGTASVRGSLASIRQLLVLGWGPDFPLREDAWRETWASAGSSENLYVYDFDDGVGGPLSTALTEVLR